MFGFLTSGTREIVDPLASVKAVSAWLRSLPGQDVIGRQQAVLGALECSGPPPSKPCGKSSTTLLSRRHLSSALAMN